MNTVISKYPAKYVLLRTCLTLQALEASLSHLQFSKVHRNLLLCPTGAFCILTICYYVMLKSSRDLNYILYSEFL